MFRQAPRTAGFSRFSAFVSLERERRLLRNVALDVYAAKRRGADGKGTVTTQEPEDGDKRWCRGYGDCSEADSGRHYHRG